MHFFDQPYLSPDQERTASPDALILSHGRLVTKMAKAFARYGMDVEDLVQEGMVALARAAARFQPEQGNRFATYATYWIRAHMREAVIKDHSVVRGGQSSKARAAFFRGRPHFDVSIEKKLAPGGSEIGVTLGDTFICPDPRPDEVVERVIDQQRLSERITAVLATLSEREADVIRCRYLTEDRPSLEEIGERYGISKERVRQIEVAALAKIRKRMGVA